mmetsp:Transcript_68225/g.134828  ORF Transcript_68225/g.134828 Transcript_68225/m.134828 type:complete len:85 (+) Transcript_68225:71-325(+)
MTAPKNVSQGMRWFRFSSRLTQVVDSTQSTPPASASWVALTDEPLEVDDPPSFADGGMSVADFRRHYVEPVLADRQQARRRGGA